jgi:hypothetical protein
MDGLSAAASIIAVVTIAIQTASVLCTTISAIKDVPKEFQNLARSIAGLQRVLEEVRKLQSKPEYAQVIRNLEYPVHSCRIDLANFNAKIARTIDVVQKGKVAALWSNFLNVVKEKQIRAFWDAINNHYGQLCTHLAIAGM